MIGSNRPAVQLDQARRLYEKGSIIEAAQILRAIRAGAVFNDDTVAEIDDYIAQMRGHLSGDDLVQFDAALAGHYSVPDQAVARQERIALSPLGLGLAGVGALLMLISVFLPRVEATSFASIEQNTLIQSGDGWWFIGLSIGVAGATYRAYHRKARTLAPMILGGIGIAVAIYEGTNKSNLRLCPVSATSVSSACEIANPGIGIYCAGVGALLALVGGFQIWTSKPRAVVVTSSASAPEPETKTCPDCAETILVKALVCKHCGYRFDGSGTQPHEGAAPA